MAILNQLSVGKPRVLTKEVNGHTMEPIEYLVIDVPPSSVGAVMEIVIPQLPGGPLRAALRAALACVSPLSVLAMEQTARGKSGRRLKLAINE